MIVTQRQNATTLNFRSPPIFFSLPLPFFFLSLAPPLPHLIFILSFLNPQQNGRLWMITIPVFLVLFAFGGKSSVLTMAVCTVFKYAVCRF
jgi:hypothetical protein